MCEGILSEFFLQFWWIFWPNLVKVSVFWSKFWPIRSKWKPINQNLTKIGQNFIGPNFGAVFVKKIWSQFLTDFSVKIRSKSSDFDRIWRSKKLVKIYFDRFFGHNSVKIRWFWPNMAVKKVGQNLFWPTFSVKIRSEFFDGSVKMKFRPPFFWPIIFGQNVGRNGLFRSTFFILSVKISVKISLSFCSEL